MRKWTTEIKALDGSTGEMKTWIGPYVEAPTWSLAQQWCNENMGYLKVVGELVMEIPCKGDTCEPDWTNATDYELIQKN
ncbi:MAG: hypothetical protein KF862_07260 [Chitinophagaceae bacterium]|nr:hypothetical protein [Chitinophagaceae bacterium]